MNDAHPDTDWGDCEDECPVGGCACEQDDFVTDRAGALTIVVFALLTIVGGSILIHLFT